MLLLDFYKNLSYIYYKIIYKVEVSKEVFIEKELVPMQL